MKKLAVLIILLFILASCGSSKSADLPDDASQEQVQAGFEDFMKEKQADDQAQAQKEFEEAQVRPVTFEPDTKQVHISIPSDLIDEYGEEIVNCYTGTGPEEKIKAAGEYCVNEIAAANDEIRICNKMYQPGESQDKCFQAAAKEQAKEEYCDLMTNEASLQACHTVVK